MKLSSIDISSAYLYSIQIIENFFDHEFKEMKQDVECQTRASDYSWQDALYDLCKNTGFYDEAIRDEESVRQSLNSLYQDWTPDGPRLSISEEEFEKQVKEMVGESREYWKSVSRTLWSRRHEAAHFRSEIDKVNRLDLYACIALSKFLIRKSIKGEL